MARLEDNLSVVVGACKLITYLAVCVPNFSVTTLIPLARVVASAANRQIIINKQKIEEQKNQQEERNAPYMRGGCT